MSDPNALREPTGAAPDAHDDLVAADDAIIGRAFRWSLVVLGALAFAVVALVWLRGGQTEQAPAAAVPIEAPRTVDRHAVAPPVRFTDITKSSGVDFVHENGATGDKLLPESLGGGVAFFDFDNDGDQDLLLVSGDHWPGAPGSGGDGSEGGKGREPATMHLYRNDGSGRFENATVAAGLDVHLYGMGVAVGDYDNDGWVDVFISAVGANHLYRNVEGRFQDVTKSAGVAGQSSQWSTSAAFIDYDNDGDLDLYVCNYVRWSKEIDFEVDYRLVGVGRAYGPPMNYEGRYSYLYRNDGAGGGGGDVVFVDVSADAGIQISNPATGAPMGKALGVAPIDVDRDGWIDLLIANDTVRNFFFHNNGDGTFAEEGIAFGLAFDRNGSATGAMGIDAGYYRNDDELGFFIGNFANEMTSLYVSQGTPLLFADEAIGEGIGAPTRLMLSFGVFLFDYDLDGRLDLLQANGHLEEEINVVQPSQHYEQPAQLFWNCGLGGRGCFVPVSADTTGGMAVPIVGRSSSFADIDADGDLDVVLTQVGRSPLLLRNEQALGHHWIRLKLIGTSSNRDAIGARIELTLAGSTLRRQVMPTRSYLSQVELPVTIGLGDAQQVESLRITWPGGAVQELKNLTADTVYTIREGDSAVTQRAGD